MAEKKHNLTDVIALWILEGEINNGIKVWTTAVLSLSYCYFVAKFGPKGIPRLAAFLPVVTLFVFLPLNLHSIHFTSLTSFFLTWLANSKLLLLAFDKGPLNASNSLPQFLALACLPIKFQTLEKNDQNGYKSLWKYAIKVVVLVLIIKGYDYSDILHPKLILVMYGLHIYLGLELILASTAAAARGLLGVELEPQFDEPYLSSSLQDFWGRRWNIAVTRVLHPTVYLPVRGWSEAVVGRRWGRTVGVMASFAVSGMMHEYMIYSMGRVRPTWELTWFFVVNGACLAAEVAVKRAVKGRWRLPRVVGTVLTVGFVTVTGCWLFIPPFVVCKAIEKGVEEVAAAGAFVKDVWGVLWH